MKTITRIVAAAVLFAASAIPAGATMMLGSMTLEATTQEADRILYAKTVEVRVGADKDGLPATWVTFEVKRTLKGSGAARVTIKQLGNSDENSNNLIARIPDLPRYTTGEEVVVFLRRDSGRGFTSPVGFEEGVYRVATENGRAVSRNRAGRSGMDLEQLLTKVAELVASQR